MKLRLDTIDKVKRFVDIVSRFDSDMDLVASNSRYIVDAKSIMGIFSLDLSKDLTLRIHNNNTGDIEIALAEFAV